MKEPTRQELANELQLIKARHEQLKRQVVELGRRTTICQKQLLDLAPQASKTERILR